MKRSFLLFLSLVFSQILIGQKHKIDLTEIAKGYYVHTSYNIYQGDSVPSNGIVVDTEGGLVLIETAWGSAQTKALLKVLKRKFHKKVLFCLATHAHEDRIGGTDFLRKKDIPTYTTPLIRQMAIERKLQIPEGTLSNDTTLVVNGVAMRYFFAGEGHTKENAVVWLPAPKILWGGCLVKSIQAVGMGFIGDANMKAWANSIRTLIREFPDRRMVIPGHDNWEELESLEYTLKLLEAFEKKQKGG
jgi:metallo-beta-lactamase class B